RDVAPLDVTGFRQALAEYRRLRHERPGRTRTKKSDHRHRRLLRARRERPRGRRAAEQRDEVAPLHSITSSARSRNDSGILRWRALAVVRLMTRSNLVGCSIGMSPGFAPRRILSTISAVRLHRSRKLGPKDIRPPASTYSREL